MIRYWFLAARPKTLAAAVLPVGCATALAFAEGGGDWGAALLCFLFAGIMQIAANFINDLFDFKKGTDGEDRLGPERACAQGWISPKAMTVGIAVTLSIAAFTGLALLPYGGWQLLILGGACFAGAFLYTTLLSYMALGDLLVWLFFGFVPVAGTFYVQNHTFTPSVWLLAAACGLVTDTLLVLNNFRDREQDARNGKRTLVVVGGERFGSALYLGQGILGYVLIALTALNGHLWCAILPLLYLLPHYLTWRKMMEINRGRALNRVLGFTARNILTFALLVIIALCIELCD